MPKIIILLVLSTVFMSACKEEPEQVLPDFPWDCDYDIGTYELLPTSIAQIPYEGNQRVVFQDSLGNETVFTISSAENLHEKSHIAGYNALQPDVDINYCFYADSKEYLLANDSLKTQLRLTLYASPSHNAPLDHLVGDHLNITIEKAAIYSLYATYGLFNTTIDQRTSPDNYTSLQLDSINCFGRTFYQVENQPLILNFTCSIFYTASEGVVLFNEIGGKRWRFERFE